jgi:hypothetical protein
LHIFVFLGLLWGELAAAILESLKENSRGLLSVNENSHSFRAVCKSEQDL